MMHQDGEEYEGEWKADSKEGRGTYTMNDGSARIDRYRAGKQVGDGVGWLADRQTAWRLLDGEPQGEISLDAARGLAEEIGLPVPPSMLEEEEHEDGERSAAGRTAPTARHGAVRLYSRAWQEQVEDRDITC